LGTALVLQVYDVDDLNNIVDSVTLGSATVEQVNARTYWAAPHSPHYPEVADFGDYCYIYGRFDDGTERQLYLTTDAGGSVSDLSDAGWAGLRIGAFRPTEETGGTELYAFMNNTPAMWRTQDSGTSWANLGSDPFDVEFEAMSRHWGGGGDFLIGNNTAGSVQAAWLDTPYTDAWYDATGPAGQRLPTAADGGLGIVSIIWI